VVGLVVAAGGLGWAAAYVGCWAFLVYAVTIEVLAHAYPAEEADADSLDSYLGDFAPAAPSTNGHVPSAVH
jgi:hypothetical protein